MEQIKKTEIYDISISYVHEKKINLISQWVAFISIMRFLHAISALVTNYTYRNGYYNGLILLKMNRRLFPMKWQLC